MTAQQQEPGTRSLVSRDIIGIDDLSRTEIDTLLDIAEVMRRDPRPDLLKGLQMASCFYEPSTRTRLSFEAAMQRLSGSVIGFSDDSTTSAKKGESLSDSVRTIEGYADVIVIRHPQEGAARLVADAVDIPVINAGDGSNQHPTQTLLDLFTIRQCQGRLDDLNIAVVGDLKYGRTVHSLARACCHYDARLFMVSPSELEIPQGVRATLREKGLRFSMHERVEEVIDKVDILYVTRMQRERFSDPAVYERLKDRYCIRPELLVGARENLKVLHPLPRRSELSTSVDATPFAYYFQQAHNGLPVRQALLATLLGRA